MRYLQRDAKASAGSLFIRSQTVVRKSEIFGSSSRRCALLVGASRHGRLRQASAPKRAVRGARTSGWVEVGRLRYPEGERGVFSARRASSRGPSVPREQRAPSFWSRKKRQRGRFSFPRGVEIARSKGSPDEHRRAQARLLERIQLGGRHGGCIHPARHSSRARPARHTRRSGYDG